MEYMVRSIESEITKTLDRGKSILLLGPRQTGKTTLVNQFNFDALLSFVQPDVRIEHEKNPRLLKERIEGLKEKKGKRPLVILDEVQKVPTIMDSVQDLIDRKIAQFILTGSSARKLRTGAHVNLLPGRIIPFHLDPFTLQEYPMSSLKEVLLYGTLPLIVSDPDPKNKQQELSAYVTTYLEQEIRMESVLRNIGHFSRFLELAASESGQLVSFRQLSQEIGVAHTTIATYYQILEDCLLVERFDPITKSKTRKKLSKSQKYVFFDLGVRRLAAQEDTSPPLEKWGQLLEQWVGLELARLARVQSPESKIRYWRDADGPEVDWVIQTEKKLIPIEVKWTESPRQSDIRHLHVFLEEYPESKQGYVLCRCSHPLKLSDRITALPWHSLYDVFLK